jgi:hypothetical protein
VPHFYWRLVKRTPRLLWRALTGLDTVTGLLTLAFGAVGVGAWQQLLPWWSPFVAFAVILFYGFLRENYEEYLQVQTNTALDVSRLKAYESRDTDRIILELLPSREWTHQTLPKRDAEGYAECLVGYDPEYDGYHPGTRTTFSVGALGGEFSVTLGHEAYQNPDPRDSSQPIEPFSVETHLFVLRCSDGEESVDRHLVVFSEDNILLQHNPEPYKPTWGYIVSATVRLLGLPEGKYGFEVRDRTNAPGRGVLYRNMHLTVSKLDVRP